MKLSKSLNRYRGLQSVIAILWVFAVSCNKDSDIAADTAVVNTGASISFSPLVNAATLFIQNSTFETYTATSCAGCPAAAIDLKNELSSTVGSRIIPMEFHNNFSTSADVITPSYAGYGTLASAFSVATAPTTFLNRSILYTKNQPQIEGLTKNPSPVGLAISSTLSGNTLSVSVQAAFVQGASQYKIVVYLLEDGIITPHQNGFNTTLTGPYASLYGLGDPIPRYVNDHVVRETLSSSPLGDNLPSIQSLGICTSRYVVTSLSKAYKPADLKIVAMVVDNAGGKLINAQQAEVGTSVPLQIIY
jgi:hypothetical protein